MRTSPRRQSRNQLRIIGGKWRGRKLDFPSVAGLRPTGDRIRETLFNWLAPWLPGARCLDLFAGSGALGLEALSRGAREVVMLDTDPLVTTKLREHCRQLEADNAAIRQMDALLWLDSNQDPGEFDLVFLDPPFQADLAEKVAVALNRSGRLADQALIYVEAGRQQAFSPPPHWALHKTKSAGQVSFSLYRHQARD